jgi:arylsulfatase A-like enzyme
MGNGQWAKNTPFEQAARSPLLIADPRQSGKGARTASPAEFTDIYPTLCELLGLPLPDFLEGKSLAAVLDDPSAKPREGAVTIVTNNWYVGYSVRSERYRYIEWVSRKTKEVRGRDLFDYAKDPNETRNLADNPEYAEVLQSMIGILHSDTAGLKLLQQLL